MQRDGRRRHDQLHEHQIRSDGRVTPPLSDPTALARKAAQAVIALPPSATRTVIALAGPPGAGKSTVGKALQAALTQQGLPTGLLPMDGFHYDNAILDARGLRARKGAPETFDLNGFLAMLARLPHEDEIAIPTFDRTLDKAIAGSDLIRAEHKTVIVEGNYLLLDEPGWKDCRKYWALRVFLDVPMAEIEARLVQRWLDHGLDPQAARDRAEQNDLPNARRVVENVSEVDVVLE